MSLRSRLIVLAALTALAACSSNPSSGGSSSGSSSTTGAGSSAGTTGTGGTSGSSGSSGTTGTSGTLPDGGVAPCHAPAVAPTCTSAPANLDPNDPLQQGFLADVHDAVGLTGHLGRRVTFGDVDGDGYPDFISIETGVSPGLQHLFMNRPSPDGGGRVFVETTQASGILQSELSDGGEQVALMATFADVDNDGDLDLFLGSYSQDPSGARFVPTPNEIYLNDGTGHFTLDTGAHVDQPWPLTTAAATFVDYDKDGKLDLFVGNFMVQYSASSGPTSYPHAYQDLLYKGDGQGGFTEVTAAANLLTPGPLGDPDGGYSKATYGVTACDYDNDGWPDLLTSSYALEADDLWHNRGDGTFEEVGMQQGYAWDGTADPYEYDWRQGGNSFAHACGDYDNDGDLDLFVAQTTHWDFPRNFGDRSGILVNTGADGGYGFYRPDVFTPDSTGDGGGVWTTAVTGIERDLLGLSGPNAEYGDEGDHGATWVDLDNDGLLDLVIEASAYQDSHAWIYHQKPDHTFEDVTELSGEAANLVNTNGMTVDDFDRDGKLDVLFGSVNANGFTAPGGVEQLHLFRNQVANGNHFLHVTLHGVTANRQGTGAKVKVTAGCLTQLREISGGKGTFGAADPAYAHFGLGKATLVDTLEIDWPTNPVKVQVLHDVAVDQFLEVTEDSDALICQGPAQ